MLVIDAEALIILNNNDCENLKMMCGLLNVFVLSDKKADGSGYYVKLGIVKGSKVEFVDVKKSGSLFSSIECELRDYCVNKSFNIDDFNYRGIVVGDDVFVVVFCDNNSVVKENLLRERFYTVRRLWLF